MFFDSTWILQGVPSWTETSTTRFPSGIAPPAGSTVTVSLDYDNDGKMDLFVPSIPRLYRNTGTAFSDVTSSAGLTYAQGDFAATGDYDGDGWVDIAVNATPQPTIYRNLGYSGSSHQGFGSGAYPSRTDSQIASPGAIAWIDIDDDGDLDLYANDNSGGGGSQGNYAQSILFLSSGGSSPSLTEGNIWSYYELRTAYYATSVSYADLFTGSGSYYPDIVLGNNQAIIKSLGSYTSSVVAPTGSMAYSNSGQSRILDYDLDGLIDVFHYARSSTTNAKLMRQTSSATFSDVASTAQVSATGINTGVVADFDGDGDIDIFQADNGTGTDYFFESWDTSVCTNPPCAAGEDDPANDFVRVRLSGHAYDDYLTSKTTNTDLIGTRLSLNEAGVTYWVQGSAGSSFAPGLPLVFATTGETDLSLDVQWPNGVVTTHEDLSANTTYDLQDQSIPYVKNSTVSVTKTLGLGTIDLTFQWDSVGPGTTDTVTLTHTTGSAGGDCYDYVTTLQANASVSQTKTALNNYRHTISWTGQDCHPGCKFDYTVKSDNGVANSWSTSRTVTIKSCIGG